MNEKVFELLEKMYIEMQEMKSNMATKQEIKELKSNMVMKQEMQEGFQRINQNIVRLESKMDENIKALYDGYKQSIEGISELKEKLDELTDKVENQEIKLQVLK